MKSSVVERGFIAGSPSRSVKKTYTAQTLSWLKQGITDTRNSLGSSLAWGLGISISTYGMYLLLSSSTTASVAYSSGLVILTLFLAAGVSATSRTLQRHNKADQSHVFKTLWAEKFNLALMGIFVSVLFTGWMTMAATAAAVTTGAGITVTGSFTGMLGTVSGSGPSILIALLTLITGLVAFALVFISLPMVIDGDKDFLNAMLTSAAAFTSNLGSSMLLALVVFGLVIVSAMIWFPLLCVIAPVVIHTLWHSYRSLVD